MQRGKRAFSRRHKAGLALACLFLALAASPPFQGLSAMPERVRIVRGDARELSRDLPLHLYIRPDRDGAIRLNGREASARRWVSARGNLMLQPLETGSYHLEMRLFRVLPIRTVTVEVVPPVTVVPGGQSIGVMLRPGGVLVVDEAAINGSDGRRHYPAREAGIEAGDLIVAINGKPVRSKEDVIRQVAAAGDGGTVRLTLRRSGRTLKREIHPVYDESRQRYLIGLWIRDGLAGIGTLSFYDPQSRGFGALGHLVADGAGRPYPVDAGSVVEAFIAGVRPGRPGEPGEKIGVFIGQDKPLGTITHNTPFGIFGLLAELPEGKDPVPIPMALEDEVRPGPAQILTVIQGKKVEAFDVVIERVLPQDRPNDKGMTVRVTDPRLLAATGGIVQGMSGSPILQGGKLAGAVTHVFVNDPTRGYAVFAEWMMAHIPRETGPLKMALAGR